MTNREIESKAMALTTIELSKAIDDLKREKITLDAVEPKTTEQRLRRRQIAHRLSLIKSILRKRQKRMKGF